MFISDFETLISFFLQRKCTHRRARRETKPREKTVAHRRRERRFHIQPRVLRRAICGRTRWLHSLRSFLLRFHGAQQGRTAGRAVSLIRRIELSAPFSASLIANSAHRLSLRRGAQMRGLWADKDLRRQSAFRDGDSFKDGKYAFLCPGGRRTQCPHWE